MPQVIFLIFAIMVLRSVAKNVQENNRKRKESENREKDYRPKGQAGGPPVSSPFSGATLRDLLRGQIPASDIPYAPPTPTTPSIGEQGPVWTQDREVQQAGSLAQGMGTEGCNDAPEDCDAPHSELRLPAWGGLAREGPAPTEALPFLHNQPELVKGVIYAEILTRPIHRRRHYP